MPDTFRVLCPGDCPPLRRPAHLPLRKGGFGAVRIVQTAISISRSPVQFPDMTFLHFFYVKTSRGRNHGRSFCYLAFESGKPVVS